MGGIRGMLSRGRAFALRQHQFCDKPLAVRSPVLLGTSLVIILCLGHVPIQVRRTASGCWLRVQRDHGIMRRTSTVGTCEPVALTSTTPQTVRIAVGVLPRARLHECVGTAACSTQLRVQYPPTDRPSYQ